jgi:hypothetical protein
MTRLIESPGKSLTAAEGSCLAAQTINRPAFALTGVMAFSGQIWAQTAQPTQVLGLIFTRSPSRYKSRAGDLVDAIPVVLALVVMVKARTFSVFRPRAYRVHGSWEIITDTPGGQGLLDHRFDALFDFVGFDDVTCSTPRARTTASMEIRP